MQELASLTEIPTFFAQSLYDGNHIYEVLGFTCVDTLQSLSECTKEDRDIIEEYKVNVQRRIQEASSTGANGAFAISCVCDRMVEGKFNNELFEVPMNSGQTVATSVKSWLQGVSSVRIDDVEWPHNSPCAHKLTLQVNI